MFLRWTNSVHGLINHLSINVLPLNFGADIIGMLSLAL